MSEEPPIVREGEVIGGKYLVERVLGQGAMGMVVAAMHIELQKRRAIKIMLPTQLDNTESYERFLREARAPAKLESKHVAMVHDVGRMDNGARYIVLEHLEGTDLHDLLNDRPELPVEEAVGYLLQACEAIGEAHQHGIVHRDLKPANLFLTKSGGGTIKVLDFGIAKVSAPEQNHMTATSTVMGTPYYMSPEQIRSSRSVDARADIWSLGVILFRMVTGTLPFFAPSYGELSAKILMEAAPIPSRINPQLTREIDAIIMKCMEKDVARRWQSVAELVNALRPFANAQVVRELDGNTHLWRGSGPPPVPELEAATKVRAPAPSTPGGTVMLGQTPNRAGGPVASTIQGIAPPPGSGGESPAHGQSGTHALVQPPGQLGGSPSGGWPSAAVSGASAAMGRSAMPSNLENGLSPVPSSQTVNSNGATQSRGLVIGIAFGVFGSLLLVVILVLLLRPGDGGNKEKDAQPIASVPPSTSARSPEVAPLPVPVASEMTVSSAAPTTTKATTPVTTKKTGPAPRPTGTKSSSGGLYGDGM